MPHRGDGEQDFGQRTTDARLISVSLPAALAALVTIITVCVTGFGSSVWWASSISTKMDVLVHQGAEQAAATIANSTRIAALELWQREINTSGSPQMIKRVDALANQLTLMREEYRKTK